MINKKLIIGTANWGQNYGALGTNKRLSTDKLKTLIQLLKEKNIDTLDTSLLYGDAVNRIMNYCDQKFQIYTKFAANLESNTQGFVFKNRALISKAITKFPNQTVHGLYVHNVEAIFSPNFHKLVDLLQEVKEKYKNLKIGISVYSNNEIEEVLKVWTPDIIQLPVNLFDRRLINSGALYKLKDRCVEIHARSIFLQGILLAERSDLPAVFDRWTENFEKLEQWCLDKNISKTAICLSFVHNLQWVDRIVLGVNDGGQLVDILNSKLLDSQKGISKLAVHDSDKLLDPRTWIKH